MNCKFNYWSTRIYEDGRTTRSDLLLVFLFYLARPGFQIVFIIFFSCKFFYTPHTKIYAYEPIEREKSLPFHYFLSQV